jgi:hypothetical protein
LSALFCCRLSAIFYLLSLLDSLRRHRVPHASWLSWYPVNRVCSLLSAAYFLPSFLVYLSRSRPAPPVCGQFCPLSPVCSLSVCCLLLFLICSILFLLVCLCCHHIPKGARPAKYPVNSSGCFVEFHKRL